MIQVVALILLTLSAGPALAGATDWQEVAPGVKLRLISSDRIDGGVTSCRPRDRHAANHQHLLAHSR